jgi:PAS domain S-box-containing protein
MFARVLEAAPDAMVVVDSNGRIVLVNGQTERLLGRNRADLLGKTFDELVPPRFRGRPLDAMPADLTYLRADGNELPVEIKVAHADGGLIVVAIRDVSEQRRMHSQLLVSDRMATIGTLAAGVAHEINNPLGAVVANLDFALEDARAIAALPSPPDRINGIIEVLREAADGAQRVTQIVRDLNIFARAEEDKRESLEVQLVLESALRMVWNDVRHRARVVRDYGDVPPVLASAARLGQVFLNLLINAAQAIPEGRADSNHIRVTTRRDSLGRVVVEIADSGCGIPPEARARIFMPFFTTKPQGLGSGLGLAICQRIVAGLGGQIDFESEVGKGTVFRVTLPGTIDEKAEVPEVRVAAAARRGRVLVVDDDRMVGAAVRRSLAAHHDVEVLASGQEALDRLLGGARYDVIICDLMMPTVTGPELYAQLSTFSPEQAKKVIFLTGGAFTPAARNFLDDVPNARLDKPFDVGRLRELVNERVAASS